MRDARSVSSARLPRRRVAIDRRRRPARRRRSAANSAAARAMPRGGASMSPPRSNRDRRLGLQAEPLARPPHGRRLEVRALQRDPRRRRRNLGIRAAHDAADRHGALGVGDDQHVRRRARARRRRACASSRPRRARRIDEPVAAQARSRSNACIGWPDLEHHVVGDVDDVVDRADAGGLEPLAQPGRRAARSRTSNTCAQ